MVLPVVVPASLSNLGPGFDVLGCALHLFNQFMFTRAEAGVFQDGAKHVDPDAHLVFSTFRAAARAFGGHVPHGVQLHQEAQVPRSRGLGSSATARVAGLLAHMHYASVRPSLDEALDFLCREEGHPDNICAAMLGGVTLGTQTPRGFRHARFDPVEHLRVALCVPDKELATEDARRVLPEQVSRGDAAFNINRTAFLMHGLVTGDAEALRIGTEDRLHQPYRAPLIGPVDASLAAAQEAGAAGAFISGSGTTLAALIVDDAVDADRVARAMRRPFVRAGVQAEAKSLRVCRFGAWRFYLDNAAGYD